MIHSASSAIGRCFGREDPGCALPWLVKLEARAKGSQAVAYARGFERFLAGDLAVAAEKLTAVAAAKVVPESLRDRAKLHAALATATHERTAKMLRTPLMDGRFVLWVAPGPDEVLIPLMESVLKRAVVALELSFGTLPTGPLNIHVYPRVEDLAAVSGLTAKQIRDSGTIALCKYNRLMITSPADLLFGYSWADTIVHELVHWVIIRRAGPGVPIWVHEGLARSFEATWRGSDPVELQPEELAALADARRRKRFIPFSKMSPTMAQLPTQEATQLAFAEVHHAVGWILQKARKEGVSGPIDVRPLLARFDAGDDEAAAILTLVGVPRKAALKQWKKDLLAGRSAVGVLPTVERETVKKSKRERLKFKRVSSADPFKGLGAQARRWIELGDRLLAINRPLAAVIEYRKALSSGAKREPIMMRRMARALVQLRRFDEAEKVAAQALQGHPQDAALLQLWAAALAGLKRHKDALKAAEQSAWINPYSPDLHLLMAQIHDRDGRKEQAERARELARLVQGPRR